jgi:hypothetical protein
LYISIVKPYFEKYEDDIDKKIDVVAADLRQRSFRQLQRVAWSVFFGGESSSLLAPIQIIMAGADKFLGIGGSSSTLTVDDVKEADYLSSTSLQPHALLAALEQNHLLLHVGTDSEQFTQFQCRFHGKSLIYMELLAVGTVSEGVEMSLPLAHTPGGEPCARCSDPSRMKSRREPKQEENTCSQAIYYIPLYCVNAVYEAGSDAASDEGAAAASVAGEDIVGVDIVNAATHDCTVLYLRHEGYAERDSVNREAKEGRTPSVQLTSCMHIASSNARGKLWRKLRAAVERVSRMREGVLLRRRFSHWRKIRCS